MPQAIFRNFSENGDIVTLNNNITQLYRSVDTLSEETLKGQLLTMDLGNTTFTKRRLYHDPECHTCGGLSQDHHNDAIQ